MACICVSCGAPVGHLYVRYPHGSVLSAPCDSCSAAGPDDADSGRAGTSSTRPTKVADPYVESDLIVVLLDLVLVKPRAFRHLLFNRPLLRTHGVDSDAGRTRRKAAITCLPDADITTKTAWLRAARSFVAVQLVDAFLRWYYLCAHDSEATRHVQRKSHPIVPGNNTAVRTRSTVSSYLSLLAATMLESVACYGLVTAIISIHVLLQRRSQQARSSRAPSPLQFFRSSRVVSALTLANVSSISLLFLILLWEARYHPQNEVRPPLGSSVLSKTLARPWLDLLSSWLLDWQPDILLRHIVTGLSSGVALAVILPRTPIVTTLAMLSGWALASTVRGLTYAPGSSGPHILSTPGIEQSASYFCPL